VRDCEKCDLQLSLEDADETKSMGIARLLADYNDTIALVPKNNTRHERRG
jgi:lysine 2,3-aminomutase